VDFLSSEFERQFSAENIKKLFDKLKESGVTEASISSLVEEI
jgi:hypothetical protein